MKIRVIETGAQDLPSHFAVAEGKTVAEAIPRLRDAFAQPGVDLVVWNGAADLVSQEEKDALRGVLEARRIYSSFHNDYDLSPGIEGKLALHFSTVSNSLGHALEGLAHTTGEIVTALNNTFGVAAFSLTEKFEKTNARAQFHRDFLMRDRANLLRALGGDATFFVDEKHTHAHRGDMFSIKDDTPHLWTIRPWAIAVMSKARSGARCGHTAPYNLEKPAPGAARAVQLLEFSTYKPITR